MNLIHNNPFRILGVTGNASLSDRIQQANLIAQYLKIGQNAKLDFDITPPLSPIERTKELIELQSSRIHSTEDKILHSLFWFVQANGVDKIALKHLTKSKDIDKALNDVEKGCRGFVVTPSSYSSILNHSSLEIIAFNEHKDLNRLKKAITRKFSLISNKDSFASLKKLVASDGKDTDIESFIALILPELKDFLSELVPAENIDHLMLEVFQSNPVIYPKIKTEVLSSLEAKMNKVLNNSELKRNEFLRGHFSPRKLTQGSTLGSKTLKSAKNLLKEMKVFVGINDSFYLDNVDKAYSEVNYCGILVFNKFIESLNNNEFQISDLNQCNLNGIVDLYSDALKELRHLEVPIKTTIAQNLTGIKKVKNQLDEIKSANSFDLNEKIQRRRQAAANNNSGCFIATATLGSYDHSLVLELRQFRDEWILTKRWGKDFVSWYYYYGGIAAKVIEDKTVLKRMSYLFIILPLVFLARVVKK